MLEEDIKAKKSQTHNKNNFFQPLFIPSDQETIPFIEPAPHQDQATLDEEDLEIHQIMREGYYAQLLWLWLDNSPYPRHDGANFTQINNQLGKLQGEDALKQPKQTFGERDLKNVAHAYVFPTKRKGSKEIRSLN